MDCIWIRHGMTEGNVKKRYIGGRTDEGLCAAGRMELEERKTSGIYPVVSRVYVSPMKRCLETASVLYPDTETQVVEGFRECDFGLFENRNDQELSGEPFYQEWLKGNGNTAFPGGEHPEAFKERCVAAFRGLLRREEMPERSAFVVHGGIIMAVFSRLDEKKMGFYEYYTENGNGYRCHLERKGSELMFRGSRRLF